MSEALLGITPILKRFAFRYVLKGVGSHAVEPPFDALYDEIIVRELYDWTTVPGKASQGGVAVEFWMMGRRLRWVEFGIHCIGGGGDPVLREI